MSTLFPWRNQPGMRAIGVRADRNSRCGYGFNAPQSQRSSCDPAPGPVRRNP